VVDSNNPEFTLIIISMQLGYLNQSLVNKLRDQIG
jgi:hypothetical protein